MAVQQCNEQTHSTLHIYPGYLPTICRLRSCLVGEINTLQAAPPARLHGWAIARLGVGCWVALFVGFVGVVASLVASFVGCVVAWLRGCVVAWMLGCVVAWVVGKVELLVLSREAHTRCRSNSSNGSLICETGDENSFAVSKAEVTFIFKTKTTTFFYVVLQHNAH